MTQHFWYYLASGYAVSNFEVSESCWTHNIISIYSSFIHDFGIFPRLVNPEFHQIPHLYRLHRLSPSWGSYCNSHVVIKIRLSIVSHKLKYNPIQACRQQNLDET